MWGSAIIPWITLQAIDSLSCPICKTPPQLCKTPAACGYTRGNRAAMLCSERMRIVSPLRLGIAKSAKLPSVGGCARHVAAGPSLPGRQLEEIGFCKPPVPSADQPRRPVFYLMARRRIWSLQNSRHECSYRTRVVGRNCRQGCLVARKREI